MEAFSLQKVEMLEEVVVSWRKVRWIWQMRQNFVAQFVQPLEHCLCGVWLGVVMEKNWAHSVDQCWLQMLQSSGHLIDLLSLLLRCNGFAGIQKAVVIRLAADHQTVTMTFFRCKFGFGKCFGVSSQSKHWAGSHQLSYKIHFLLHITVWSRNGSLLLHRISDDPSKWRTSLVAQTEKCLPTMWETQVWCLGWEDPLEKEMATHSSTLPWKIPWTEKPGSLQSMGLQRVTHDWATKLSLSLQNDDLFNFWSAREAPTYQDFYLSSLLQMPNYHRMVNLEFFGNFSGSCKRFRFDDCSQLHFSLSCIREGNGNPLQCSCLENPTDGGA